MKKLYAMILCLALIPVLAGCGSGGAAASGKTGSQSATVQDVLEAGMAAADATPSPTATPAPAATPAPTPAPDNTTGTVDVDLTVLSSTMVYSEVYNMVYHPEDYIGKTVKMDGAFAYYHDEATGNDYFACIVQDATACCAEGIEFVLAGAHAYPEDYPALDEEICVVGEFDTYREGDYTYCTLRNARLM